MLLLCSINLFHPSKTQADKVQLCLDRCLFPRFLEEVGGIIEMRAREKGIDFEYKIDSNIPIGVKVDRKRLRQILLNLLLNITGYCVAKITIKLFTNNVSIASSQYACIKTYFDVIYDAIVCFLQVCFL